MVIYPQTLLLPRLLLGISCCCCCWVTSVTKQAQIRVASPGTALSTPAAQEGQGLRADPWTYFTIQWMWPPSAVHPSALSSRFLYFLQNPLDKEGWGLSHKHFPPSFLLPAQHWRAEDSGEAGLDGRGHGDTNSMGAPLPLYEAKCHESPYS